MIEALFFNRLLSLSTATAILEASDWDEDIFDKISGVLEDTPGSIDIDRSKADLSFNLRKEGISDVIIENVLIIIDIELSKIKSMPRLL